MLNFLTLQYETFGLEINDTSVKIIKLKKTAGGFLIVTFCDLFLKQGIVENGVILKEDLLAKAIKKACQQAKGEKLKTRYVSASLPEEKAFIQVIEMPKMEQSELKSAVLFEAENYIPLPVEDVYLDFEIVSGAKASPGKMNVLLAAMPKKIVNSYASCIKKAGLIPFAFEIESQATARAFKNNSSGEKPFILIDIGENNTDFVVFADGAIRFTSSIALSSNQISGVISKALNVNLKNAEKLRNNYGVSEKDSNLKGKAVFEALNPSLQELVSQIKKYIDFYQDRVAQESSLSKEIEKICLCGSGASLKGLTDYLSKGLKLPVESVKPCANASSKVKDDSLSANPLSFMTVLGLAMRKFYD